MVKRKRSGRQPKPVTRAAPREMEFVFQLLEEGNLVGARDELIELADRRQPHPLVLEALAEVSQQLQDWRTYLYALELWHQQDSANPDVVAALAGAYLLNHRPILARQTFETFLKRWPDHKHAEQARHTMKELVPAVDEVLIEMGLEGPEGMRLAVLHEQAQSLLDQGRFRESRATAQRLLRQRPTFVPAMNNLTLVQLMDGRYDQAIATARRALEVDPANIHARANLIRALVVSGHLEEAREEAARLSEADVIAPDLWVKVAEALSFVGDCERLDRDYERAKDDGALERPAAGLLSHLAAVAAFRLGNEREARKRWQRALRDDPGLAIVSQNLADLRKPVGERNGPWAFEFANWISERTMDHLSELVSLPEEKRPIRRLLRQHPELKQIIPLLLERGDPFGRRFAVLSAIASDDPDLHAVLREFAFGQEGSDALRHQAAQGLVELGIIQPGDTVRMWVSGSWADVPLPDVELDDEPLVLEINDQVSEWYELAIEAMQEGEFERAEGLLKKALEVEPQSPDLQNNLAAAYLAQGRWQEAEAGFRAILAEHPDFILATIGLGRLLTARRRFEEAHAVLDPLLTRKRFHAEEYLTFGATMAELLLAEGDREGARSWVGVLQSIAPGHPGIQVLASRL